MKKHPEIQEATRRNFTQALIELYARQPLDKISVQALSARAGYNRATFYRYFSSVYELYGYAEEWSWRSNQQQATPARTRPAPTLSKSCISA